MIFNSYAFLAFFPIVTLAYYRMPMRARRPWLLAASYYFYMCWNAQYALLIAASTLVTYLCALALGRMDAKTGRRAVLALGLAINLGILCFFKYSRYFFFPISTYRSVYFRYIAVTNAVYSGRFILPSILKESIPASIISGRYGRLHSSFGLNR